MPCPVCDQPYDEGTATCVLCGAALQAAASPPPTVSCSSCGAANEPGALLCSMCGELFAKESDGPAQEGEGDSRSGMDSVSKGPARIRPPKPGSGPSAGVIGCLALGGLALLALVGAVFFVGGDLFSGSTPDAQTFKQETRFNLTFTVLKRGGNLFRIEPQSLRVYDSETDEYKAIPKKNGFIVTPRVYWLQNLTVTPTGRMEYG